jgi:hypothetical protein
MKDVKIKKVADGERVHVSDSCFIFTGIKKSNRLSDADMIGLPILYGRTVVGTVMDQWDGKTLVDVDAKARFIIEDYKSGQIRGEDLKTQMGTKS